MRLVATTWLFNYFTNRFFEIDMFTAHHVPKKIFIKILEQFRFFVVTQQYLKGLHIRISLVRDSRYIKKNFEQYSHVYLPSQKWLMQGSVTVPINAIFNFKALLTKLTVQCHLLGIRVTATGTFALFCQFAWMIFMILRKHYFIIKLRYKTLLKCPCLSHSIKYNITISLWCMANFQLVIAYLGM